MMVSKVTNIPAIPLTAYAQYQWDKTLPKIRLDYVRKSPDLWTISDDEDHVILIAGVLVPAPIGHAELWVLLCRDFERQPERNIYALRGLLPTLKLLYPNLLIHIEAKNEEAKRFARLFRFSPTSEFGPAGHEVWRAK